MSMSLPSKETRLISRWIWLLLLSIASTFFSMANADSAITTDVSSVRCVDEFLKSQASNSCTLVNAEIKHQESTEHCELITACQQRIGTESKTHYDKNTFPIEIVPLIKNRVGNLVISLDG